ncbi:hypothetical protein PMAYCL1PPCAC_01089, partial [Pristionchus mayeri]
MKALDAARKGVAIAIAKASGKEDDPEVASNLEDAKAEAGVVEKETVAALTAFNQKASQMTIEMCDTLVEAESELRRATKAALAP